MAFFNQDFLQFFIDLAPNNNKEWFDENRSRYHRSVKEPFEVFVNALIQACRTIDQTIPEDLTHKNCMFRINRDIRFSKDKTPYKMNRSAVIGPYGKKDHGTPSLYFEAGPEHFRLYSGVYMPGTELIESVRKHISKAGAELDEVINDPVFKQHFGWVHGEKYKVLPKQYKGLEEDIPLIKNKSWYIYKTYDPEILLQDNLVELVTKDYERMQPFQQYFRKAVGFK